MGLRNLFRRKDDTVIDLSDLQKRGILKRKEHLEKKQREEIVDLTTPASIESSPLGFLGNLAGSASSEIDEQATSETNAVSSVFNSERKRRLKGILRDMKTEIKNSTDRIYKLTDRIDLLERKIERLERKAGYGQ